MSQAPVGIALPRLTPAVKVLLVTNTALFVLLGLAIKLAPAMGVALFENLALSVAALAQLKVWTVVSYAFVHSLFDVFHLLFNMLLLYFFGPMLERRWGTRQFMFFYLGGALGGGLVFAVFNLAISSDAPVVGASAAVLALIVAWGFLFPQMPIYFFGLLPLKGYHLIAITVAIELLLAVSQSPVSSAAHFGGMATGALLVTGYWRPRKLWERLRPKKRARVPKLSVFVNPKDDDKAPPGGWVN
ncbi:MAG: rhomboid family intramembrane serine protease [Deltaproteobacteria bacterium]|nr:rhomboid family intramembrane serine protease [Deltaproteobacteria bacterium]